MNQNFKDPLFPDYNILIVDDEEHAIKSIEIVLRSEGINNLLKCSDSREALGILRESNTGIMLLDLSMPHISGEDLLLSVTRNFPDITIVIITGNNQLETAVKCMRNGAYDYIVKPVDKDTLVTRVKNALNFREVKSENIHLKNSFMSENLENPEAFSGIITKNHKMHTLFQYAQAISKSSQPVLITGETGVGKELFAKALHILGNKRGDFVPVNIAGMDDNIFSDTLFGHKKGAFTGADENRDGMIKKASNGTLFLDEIGDVSQSSQIKLLRFIQENEYNPLGSDTILRSDTKIIMATNQNLIKLKDQDRFRKDLYYRLCSHHIHIPPLRERKDDIPLLADFYFEKISSEMGIKKPFYSEELTTLISAYDFPGNIRELISMIHKALSTHKGRNLSFKTFKETIGYKNDTTEPVSPCENKILLPDKLPTLKEISDLLTKEALKRTKGNQSAAASILGITQQAMSKRLKQKSSLKLQANLISRPVKI